MDDYELELHEAYTQAMVECVRLNEAINLMLTGTFDLMKYGEMESQLKDCEQRRLDARRAEVERGWTFAQGHHFW